MNPIKALIKQWFWAFAPSLGGGGGGDVTQSTEPWSGQQPHLQNIFQGAQDLYNSPGPQFFPNQTFANFSPETGYALTAQTYRALNGSPLIGSAQQQANDTLQGNYLGSNPYLDKEFDRVQDRIDSSVNSAFSKAGRFGSGLHAAELARQTGQAAGEFYGDNYRNERQNQLRTMAFAPQLANQDYFDVGQLAAVGDARRNLAQQSIDDARTRFDFYDDYNHQLKQLQDYAGLVGGSYGSETTQEGPESDPLTSGLGILGLGASIFSGGGGGGLLGGLFS